MFITRKWCWNLIFKLTQTCLPLSKVTYEIHLYYIFMYFLLIYCNWNKKRWMNQNKGTIVHLKIHIARIQSQTETCLWNTDVPSDNKVQWRQKCDGPFRVMAQLINVRLLSADRPQPNAKIFHKPNFKHDVIALKCICMPEESFLINVKKKPFVVTLEKRRRAYIWDERQNFVIFITKFIVEVHDLDFGAAGAYVTGVACQWRMLTPPNRCSCPIWDLHNL